MADDENDWWAVLVQTQTVGSTTVFEFVGRAKHVAASIGDRTRG